MAKAQTLNLSRNQLKRRTRGYKRLHEMRELKTDRMPHFAGPDGERSFLGMIDDSERILNGYSPSREEQGKENWQSNIVDNITRAKLRAIAAGVGLKVPEMIFDAVNANGLRSKKRAEMMKQTTKKTFESGNPILHTFLEVWQMLSHGVLFEYEGYETGGAKRKRVTSFDSRTGEVEFESEYVEMTGKPVSIILNPQEFYWADWYKKNVQDQPYIAWVQRYNKQELEQEFSKYKNYDYIKTKKQISTGLSSMQETLYYKKWEKNVGDEEYEVFRYYSLEDDEYIIWVNGVEILYAPMLWGDEADKYYPFAHTIAEPFANPQFMVGMSFPQLLEGFQESKTTVINTLVDKLYRSLKPPTLVGLANKDLLDMAEELVDEDYKIYVPDVNQVKPFPFDSVQQADMAMLSMLSQSIDSISIDPGQQGIQQENVTARASLIADERSREQKSILFTFLEDLWRQKYRLRIPNILTHYLKDKAARSDFNDKTITIPDYNFGNGERGVLEIHIAQKKSELLSIQEIEARELAMEEQGMPYKVISVMPSYLENWKYDYRVVQGSLHNQSRMRQDQEFMEEVQTVTTLFPEFFAANKDKYLENYLENRGKNISEFEPPAEAPTLPVEGEEAAPEGAPAPIAAQGPTVLGLE